MAKAVSMTAPRQPSAVTSQLVSSLSQPYGHPQLRYLSGPTALARLESYQPIVDLALEVIARLGPPGPTRIHICTTGGVRHPLPRAPCRFNPHLRRLVDFFPGEAVSLRLSAAMSALDAELWIWYALTLVIVSARL